MRRRSVAPTILSLVLSDDGEKTARPTLNGTGPVGRKLMLSRSRKETWFTGDDLRCRRNVRCCPRMGVRRCCLRRRCFRHLKDGARYNWAPISARCSSAQTAARYSRAHSAAYFARARCYILAGPGYRRVPFAVGCPMDCHCSRVRRSRAIRCCPQPARAAYSVVLDFGCHAPRRLPAAALQPDRLVVPPAFQTGSNRWPHSVRDALQRALHSVLRRTAFRQPDGWVAQLHGPSGRLRSTHASLPCAARQPVVGA
jgi:hypothetical protein